MVYLIVKNKGRKVYRQYHSNRKSALNTMKFIKGDKSIDYVRIETDMGKISKAKKTSRRSSSPFGLNFGRW